MLKMTLELKASYPKIFLERDPFSKDISDACEILNMFYLPVSPSGHLMLYSSLRNYSVHSFNFEVAMKLFFMTSEVCFLKQGETTNVFLFFFSLAVNNVYLFIFLLQDHKMDSFS
jgi:hypothetical protein